MAYERYYSPVEADVEEEYECLRSLARAAQSQHYRDRYNRRARDLIFGMNNRKCEKDEIDLHRLWVEEAIELLKERVEEEIAKGSKGIHVIVGIGSHSRDRVRRLKPAVEELCRTLKLQVVEEGNPGRVYISLPTPPQKDQIRKAQTPPQRATARRTSERQQQQPQKGISSGESPHHRRSSSTFRYWTPSAAPGVSAVRPRVVPIPKPTGAWPPMPHPQDSEGEGEGESADVPEEPLAPWLLWGLAAAVVVILLGRFLRF